MRRIRIGTTIVAFLVLAMAGAGVSARRETAQDILARSIQAHGGDRLTAWKTMVVEGTIDMQDGITYHAAYRLWAKLPGKLRVEHDLTADRGRRFDQYLPERRRGLDAAQPDPGPRRGGADERWLDQCYGVAFYGRHAAAFTLQPDAAVDWQVPVQPGSTTLKVVETRPAWVLRGTVNGVAVDLFIDKERSYLLQEATPDGRRVFWDFQVFAGRTWPTKINEFTKGRQGEALTPIVWKSVKYNVPVEEWLFEEDRPGGK